MVWLIGRVGPLSHTDLKDDFFFIGQFIGQIFSIQVADVMTRRLADLCRGEITAGTICSLSVDELKKIGISLRKAECIRQIEFMEETGSLDFGKLKEISASEIVKFLTSIKCIENWTAKMYLYRILYRLFSLTSSMDSLPVMCLMSILTISRWPKPLAISSDKLGSPGEYLSASRFKAARFSVSSVNM